MNDQNNPVVNNLNPPQQPVNSTPEVTPVAPVVEPVPMDPVNTPTQESKVLPGTPTEPLTPDALTTNVKTENSTPVESVPVEAPIEMQARVETSVQPQTMSVSDLMAPPPSEVSNVEPQVSIPVDNTSNVNESVEESIVEKNNSVKKKKFNVVLLIILIVVIGGVVIAYFLGLFPFLNNKSNNTNTNANAVTDTKIAIENAQISGHTCINDKCNLTLLENDDYVTYELNTKNDKLVVNLDDYDYYIYVTLYYEVKNSEKVIVDYKIFDKENNKEITGINSTYDLDIYVGNTVQDDEE